jgi:hypothetical protein
MVLQKNNNHPTMVYSLREQGILLLPVGTVSHLLFRTGVYIGLISFIEYSLMGYLLL